MDETRLRKIVREEILLAMKTLEDQTYRSDPEDEMTVDRALSYFTSYAYEGACEQADEQRALAAERANPFDEPEPSPADAAVQAVVRTEVLSLLTEMRDTFRMSGMSGDYLIAERLDWLIIARKRTAGQ